jgi:hypothetical protein
VDNLRADRAGEVLYSRLTDDALAKLVRDCRNDGADSANSAGYYHARDTTSTGGLPPFWNSSYCHNYGGTFSGAAWGISGEGQSDCADAAEKWFKYYHGYGDCYGTDNTISLKSAFNNSCFRELDLLCRFTDGTLWFGP